MKPTTPTPPVPKQQPVKPGNKERLAQALKDNLKRRKAASKPI